LIAANWKMHKTPKGRLRLCMSFYRLVAGHDRDEIVLCVPLRLAVVVDAVKDQGVFAGAQNVHWAHEGARLPERFRRTC